MSFVIPRLRLKVALERSKHRQSCVGVSPLVLAIEGLAWTPELSRGSRILSDGVAGGPCEGAESPVILTTGEVGPRRAGVRVDFFLGFLSFFSFSDFSFIRSLSSIWGNSSSLSFLFLPRFSLTSTLVVAEGFAGARPRRCDASQYDFGDKWSDVAPSQLL